MTLLLFADLETLWLQIAISLIHLVPEFVGLWVVMWLIRSLLMGKD